MTAKYASQTYPGQAVIVVNDKLQICACLIGHVGVPNTQHSSESNNQRVVLFNMPGLLTLQASG